MTPKEAEKKYGKELAKEIWGELDLMNIIARDTPEGLDIYEQDWESALNRLKK